MSDSNSPSTMMLLPSWENEKNMGRGGGQRGAEETRMVVDVSLSGLPLEAAVFFSPFGNVMHQGIFGAVILKTASAWQWLWPQCLSGSSSREFRSMLVPIFLMAFSMFSVILGVSMHLPHF